MTGQDHKLTIGHCNIQGGLLSVDKSNEIKSIISRHDIDILSLNETNLNDTIDSQTLNIPPAFNIIRRDRGKGSRGGCAVLISKNCAHKEMEFKTGISDIEAIWLKIKSSNIFVCAFYRSTKFCKLDKFLDYMTECMNKIAGKRVIWIGDLNIDQNKINSPDYKKLDATLKSFGLVQTIKDFTRIAKRKDKVTNTIIDVIFTNCYGDFESSEVLPDRIGDHQAIKCQLNFMVKKAAKFEKKIIRDFSVKNTAIFFDYLKYTDYSQLMLCTNTDEAAFGLDYHMTKNFDTFFPLKTIKVHEKFIYKPSPETLKAIKTKQRLYSKFRKKLKKVQQHGCEKCRRCDRCKRLIEAWDKFKEAKNRATLLGRLNKKANLAKDLRQKSAKKDLKGVWKSLKFAANMAPKSNKQPSSVNLDANKLNDHFCTVGPKVQSTIPESTTSMEEYLNEIEKPDSSIKTFENVTTEQVIHYINTIENDKAIADVLPIRVYKAVIKAIIIPITHIINLSLTSGIFPNFCKHAKVSALHKGGCIEDPGNYRPISILPLLGKCIEYFVAAQLSSYFEENDIFSEHQFGFRKEHSTTYLMNNLMDKIYDSKSNNYIPSMVFLDIKKAFDTVDHKILIKKLKFYGVDGTVILWIQNFLSDRYQVTRVGNTISSLKQLLCGVPQGSILGPLLFSIFINDLSKICHLSYPFFFADDGALMFQDTCRKSFIAIKLEMLAISDWLRANRLCLNTQKTNFMVLDNVQECSSIKLGDGSIIQEVKTTKYLGLILDSHLKFDKHVDLIKKKVLKRIGAMYRASSLLPTKHKKMFANSLMLPMFDYLDTVYMRANKTKLGELDIIYKKVAKIALGARRTESSINVYCDMKWLPLHLRRQLHLSSYVYKILNGACPKSFDDKFNYISGGSRNAENCDLHAPRSRSQKHFYYLGAKCWNSVPPELRSVDNANSLSKFMKNRLLKSIKDDQNYQVNNAYNYFYKIKDDEDTGVVPVQIANVMNMVR